MKNKSLLIALLMPIFLAANLNAQSPLTGVVTDATYDSDCHNGSINLTINGSNPPYDVEWFKTVGNFPFNIDIPIKTTIGVPNNNGQEDISDLRQGTYKVIVSDDICRTASATFKVRCICKYDCTVEGVVTDVNCFHKGSINIALNCVGPTPTSLIKYLWSDGSALKNRTNLDPGEYCVTVTDKSADCTFENCFTVDGGNTLQVEIKNVQNQIVCSTPNPSGQCSGSIDIEVTNGIPPFQYLWSNGAITQDLNNACNGTYTVTVTDNSGCSKTISRVMCCCYYSSIFGGSEGCVHSSNGDDLMIRKVKINQLPGNGSIITEVSGGTGSYICTWTGPNGFHSKTCGGSGLISEPGQYCLKVDDGCNEVTQCFEVVDCSIANINVTASVLETCTNIDAGSISLSISGGTSPYLVIWDNGRSGTTINRLVTGEYCATVTDANGCTQGPLCFVVGSQPGTVSTSSVPCTRTVRCNDEDYVDYFNYITSYDCNTVYKYCPATGETLSQDLGWLDTYVSGCILYGICQDGSLQVIEYGNFAPGPFTIEAPDCPYNYGCVNYACSFPTYGYLRDEGSTEYCSTVYYYSPADGYNCGENRCYAKIYCGSTLMAEGCVDYNCSFLQSGGGSGLSLENSSEIKLPTIVNSESNLIQAINDSNKNSLNTTIASIKPLSLNEDQTLSMEMTLKVFPNPFNGKLNIQIREFEKPDVLFEIYNILGKKVLSVNTQFEIGSNINILELSSLQSGMYFLNVIQDQKIIGIEKIVKN